MALVAVSAVGLALARLPPEGVALMLTVWAMHSVIAAVLSSPVVFWGRNRVRWGPGDLLAFVLPFGVWLALSEFSAPTGKSLANLIEPFYFALATPVAAPVRVLLGGRGRQWVCSLCLAALVCLTAACVFWLTPPLPE
jgi:hypothetical protein